MKPDAVRWSRVCAGAVVPAHDHEYLLHAEEDPQLEAVERATIVTRPADPGTCSRPRNGSASSVEIDQLGIVPATRLAASRALKSMHCFPNYLLTDFRLELPELDLPQSAMASKVTSVRSASLAHLSLQKPRVMNTCVKRTNNFLNIALQITRAMAHFYTAKK